MRMLVMGAGALGTVVGGFMAKAGHDVTLVGRPRNMDAIRAHGLRITGIWGEHHVATVHPCAGVEELTPGALDLVLLTVKSYDTHAAITSLAPFLGPGTLVCSYQNGLGNAEVIAEVIGWPRTFGARAIFGAWLREPGWVEVTVIADPTALGTYDTATPAERVRAIAAAMNNAGIPTVYTDEIATVLWSKVTYNCALNPLSGLLDVPYGVLLETEHTRSILREVVQEVYAVADAMGVRLKPATAESYIDLLFQVLIPPTAAHYASMREDFRRRRRTEIDALNGAIVRHGELHGVPCPTNSMLARLVRAREHALSRSAANT